jgi:hypothetical protein
MGALGAVVLYLVMPPGRPVQAGEMIDGAAHKREVQKEFGARLFIAIVFSILCGDWVVDMAPAFLMAHAHPLPFWVAAGAPGWWISRWAALWLYKRQDKDIGEVADEIKSKV